MSPLNEGWDFSLDETHQNFPLELIKELRNSINGILDVIKYIELMYIHTELFGKADV